jgi:hypothetical protein
MKLFYFQVPQGNVGDDLNAWLWPKILSPILDDNEDHLLIGIGTLLNHKIPPAKRYTVLTTGVGYGNLPNLQIGKWSYVGLRGPLSQNALGIKDKLVLLDGAYLLPRFLERGKNVKHKVGYVPHVDSIIYGLWEEVGDMVGMKLLDPRWEVERFVEELCSCEKVVAESMHGAILADAYNIPWQPTKAYDYINEFKWNDWAASLNMKVHLSVIASTWKGDVGGSLKRQFINKIKRLVLSVGLYPKGWTPVLPARSSSVELENIAKTIQNNVDNCAFYLSDQSLRETKTDLLLEAIEQKLLKR